MATLGETVESLLAQTYSEWEAVVVDDGSTDLTSTLAAAFARRDPRICVVRQPASGVSAARNLGIATTRHEWLLFLDADDWLLPAHLELLTTEVAADPELGLVYAGCQRVTASGERLPLDHGWPQEELFRELTQRCGFGIHCALVRRSAVTEVGGFDTALVTCEDWDLWQRIARSPVRVRAVREVLALRRARPDSATADGGRLFEDGSRVVARGHDRDERVPRPAPGRATGEAAERLASSMLTFAVWAAAIEIAAGRDPGPILQRVREVREPALDPRAISESILHGALVANGWARRDWASRWPVLEEGVRGLLSTIEASSGAQDLARRCLVPIARAIAEAAEERPIRMATLRVDVLEVTSPTPRIAVPPGVERVLLEVRLEGAPLGSIELPAFGESLSADVVADAIASDFAWPCFERYVESRVWPELGIVRSGDGSTISRSGRPLAERLRGEGRILLERTLAARRWELFLQELFGRPDWPEESFYDARAEEPPGPERTASAEGFRFELSEPIPSLRAATARELTVVPTIGGVALGALAMSAPNGHLSAAELRAAVVLECGRELLVAAVREGLVGSPIGVESLRARLARAAIERAHTERTDRRRLGRRGLAGVDSVLSRRAVLPERDWPEIAAIAGHLHEPVDETRPDAPCVYAPEWIVPSRLAPSPSPVAPLGEWGGRSNRETFEEIFAAGRDPWDYGNEYESRKYDESLSLVPDGVGDALELACAEGLFTTRLATRVRRLVAADISRIALERAASRCAELRNVSFHRLDLVADELPGPFDLVVCSEVLYYVGERPELDRVAAKLAAAMRPGGHLLTAHAHLLADDPGAAGFAWGHPFGAKGIGEALARVPGLRLVREIRTPLYRVQLYRRGGGEFGEPEIVTLPDTGAMPPAVAALARWSGGEAPTPLCPEARTDRLPILLYHRVARSGPTALRRYRVSPDEFGEQLDYLCEAGFQTIGLGEWRAAMARHAPLPGRAVVLTFDDATRDFAEHAWPQLRARGFRATLFAVTGEAGGEASWDRAHGDPAPLLSWNELRRLRDEGVEIGSHAHRHRHLTALAPADVVVDAMRSRRTLWDELGLRVRSFCYPYGDHDRVVRHLVGASGFDLGVTCRAATSSLWDDPMELPRLEIEGSDDFATFVRKVQLRAAQPTG